MDNLTYIRKNISQDELFLQLAEECMELAHVCMKMHRIINGSNPTPAGICDTMDHVEEELSDVALCCDILDISANNNIMKGKLARWVDRLGASNGW